MRCRIAGKRVCWSAYGCIATHAGCGMRRKAWCGNGTVWVSFSLPTGRLASPNRYVLSLFPNASANRRLGQGGVGMGRKVGRKVTTALVRGIVRAERAVVQAAMVPVIMVAERRITKNIGRSSQ